MIKVDVISGFLGAGKTTFIKKIIDAGAKNAEKIVVIENEFGEAGIDGKILQSNGLKIFEISKGCLCCSLKNDFITTLLEIIQSIEPDRIIVEPSGIFVLSEIFDILKIPEVSSSCYLNSVITIVDCIHFMKFRKKYNFFFENQIKYSTKLVLSKIESVDDETVKNIIEELHEINPEKIIISDKWANILGDRILYLLSANPASDCETENCVSSKNYRSKLNQTYQKNHGFNVLSIAPQNEIEREILERNLSNLKSDMFGTVIRAKGFVKSSEGFLEFNYIDGEFNIKLIDLKITPSINFIGEQLNTKGLSELFA